MEYKSAIQLIKIFNQNEMHINDQVNNYQVNLITAKPKVKLD